MSGFPPKQKESINTNIEHKNSDRCDTGVGSKTKEMKEARKKLIVVD